MEASRLRILQLLQKNTNDTVEGLAKAIGLAPATIRRHLDVLQRDRLVSFKEVRKKTGRPEHSFFLTDDGHEALPKDYDLLLNMLIQELVAMPVGDTTGRNGGEILDLVFQRLSANVWNEYEDLVKGRDLEYRLGSLMKLLDQQHFFPEVEVTDGILRIRLLNCPFRLVTLENDAVCGFDSHLISAMLNMDVDRHACIHNGDSGCTYATPVDDHQAKQLLASA